MVCKCGSARSRALSDGGEGRAGWLRRRATGCSTPMRTFEGSAGTFPGLLRRGAGLEEPVLLHPVVDLVAREPEELGGLRLVPLGALEGLHDEVAVELRQVDPALRQREGMLPALRR